MAEIHGLEIEFDQNGERQTIWPTLIKDNAELILIDCGYPGFLLRLEAAAARSGVRLDAITKLLLTHHDMDHMGSAAALKRKYPRMEIMAYEPEIPYITGSRKALRIEQAEASLSQIPAEEKIAVKQFIGFLKTIEPVQVTRPLLEGELLPWCGGIEVVPTPGHTAGHISFYLPASQTLIAGDAVAITDDGKLGLANPQYAEDLEEAVKSIDRLLNYRISQLICYHGGVYQGDAEAALRQLLREYD